ncbi:MAG: hypothetical protein ACXABY_03610, partial [Candidatus Thorarchaeota archaeon]
LVDLAIGVYELEVTVTDTLANSRSVSFTVTVETTLPVIDTTLLIAVGGGVAILVVVLVIFLRKRG